MNLTTKDLKNIFLKYVSSKQAISNIACPSADEIMEALRFPSKRSKKIMNHILECHKCLPFFIFLKEIAKAEEELINSIEKIRFNKENLLAKQKATFSNRFVKFAPYVAVSMLIFLMLYTSIKYFSLSEKIAIRSPRSETHFLLIETDISKEPCTFYLKWNKIPQAKSYSIHIFDSSLICLWSHVTSENMCLLPNEICEKIRTGQQLTIYFEAKEEEGKIIYNWLGELSSLQVISDQKLPKNLLH